MPTSPAPRKRSAAPAGTIRFLLDGDVRTVTIHDPTRTVLQYLREDLARTGTKEGCAEGDCGACTVVVAEPAGERVRFRAINACIQFLPTLDGKALFTVESLKRNGQLHPVQRAMAEGFGSQCGFCTPGFVMSLFALYKTDPAPGRDAINDALAGNLCRCTGYRPIIDAACGMYESGDALPVDAHDAVTASARATSEESEAAIAALRRQLLDLRRRSTLTISTTRGTFHAPRTTSALAKLRADLPDARMLAGGTDVGLWVTKQHRALGDLIYLGAVAGLSHVVVRNGVIDVGAAVSLTDAAAVIAARIPAMAVLLRRFASPPIRNAGTLCGNIANGSPIGDSMPPLIALGARVVLRHGSTTRELPLEDLYLAYQKTAMQIGEFVERVLIPVPAENVRFATYKISKRFDQDISAVCAAFAFTMADATIRSARVAFGGMAATPKRAGHCESALAGAPWNDDTCARASAALSDDYQPLSDMRASATYRLQVARNLLRRFLIESTGTGGAAASSVYDLRYERLEACA